MNIKTREQAEKRLRQLYKVCFDPKYKERKLKLFARCFNHKTPTPPDTLDLDIEAGEIIKKWLPEMAKLKENK